MGNLRFRRVNDARSSLIIVTGHSARAGKRQSPGFGDEEEERDAARRPDVRGLDFYHRYSIPATLMTAAIKRNDIFVLRCRRGGRESVVIYRFRRCSLDFMLLTLKHSSAP